MARPHHVHAIRVGFIDTDAARIVHHATYLRFLEAARGEFLRHNRWDYRTWSNREHLGLAVAETTLRYRAPAFFDDLIEVETWVVNARRASMVFESVVRRDGQVLALGTTKLACMTMQGALRTMPIELLKLCLGDEFDPTRI